eukprot:760873-Hanusia_phi.AAC.1
MVSTPSGTTPPGNHTLILGVMGLQSKEAVVAGDEGGWGGGGANPLESGSTFQGTHRPDPPSAVTPPPPQPSHRTTPQGSCLKHLHPPL